MQKMWIVLFLGLSLSLASCSDDDNTTAAPSVPRPSPKPLPVVCDSPLTLQVRYNFSQVPLKYVLQIGVASPDRNAPPVYGEKIEVLNNNQNARGFDYVTLDRGLTYNVHYSTVNRSGYSANTIVNQFYVPTCEERAVYQQANPNYSEPVEANLTFTYTSP